MDSSCNQIQPDQIIVQPQRPWLQMDGKVTPDEYLKTLTPGWSTETWDRYLTWFEGQGSESLISPWRYDKVCEESTESIFEFAQSNADDELRNRVAQFLAELTEQQRQVIEMIFWHGRSERYVARELGIKQVSVHGLKKRALNKISGLLKGAITSPFVRGEISPLFAETREVNGKEVLDLALGDLPKAG